jgi:hypothetical protein
MTARTESRLHAVAVFAGGAAFGLLLMALVL